MTEDEKYYIVKCYDKYENIILEAKVLKSEVTIIDDKI